MNKFFNIASEQLPDNVVSETFHTIHGYKLKCIKSLVKVKNKEIVEERWFCLKELEGSSIPSNIREGAKHTRYKSYNKFFAALGYYNQINKLELMRQKYWRPKKKTPEQIFHEEQRKLKEVELLKKLTNIDEYISDDEINMNKDN